MKRKKTMKLKIPKKSANEISEIRALLGVVEAIKAKESELKQKNIADKKD